MTDLADVLKKHVMWLLDEEGGVRANLRNANLRGADLSGADLSGADLSDANLSDADLSGADLRNAKGFVRLAQTDAGYFVIASKCGEQWRILAGCRDFSIEEARAHWGAADYHTPTSGRRVVACLDWFEAELRSGTIES